MRPCRDYFSNPGVMKVAWTREVIMNLVKSSDVWIYFKGGVDNFYTRLDMGWRKRE
jgi:hypothetical protein